MSITDIHSESIKQSIPKSKVRANRYYLLVSNRGDESIAFCYTHNGSYCFGYNTADGGGYILLRDLIPSTEIYPLSISYSRP